MRKGLLWCSSLYNVPMNVFYIEEAVQVSLSNGGRDTISAAMEHHQPEECCVTKNLTACEEFMELVHR